MAAKIWAFKKRDKNRLTSIDMKIFQKNYRDTIFDQKKKGMNFVRAESRTS
jgi:hypothetical protein